MTLSSLKTQLPILRILALYGHRPDHNHMLHCPFHPDRTPSLKVYPQTGTVYCFSTACPTHGHSMDVIDLVMWLEGWQYLGKEGKNRAIQHCKKLTQQL